MALKLKYTDEHGILHIDMTPAVSPIDKDITDPKFDTINKRFGQYDLFGGKYDDISSDGGETRSLFRSRYNSLEEELANTPYAFATERTLRSDPVLDITIDSNIEDDRFLDSDLFGPKIDLKSEPPAFTVTQLIHAQDRYYDLSNRDRTEKDSSEVKSAPCSARRTVKVESVKSAKDDAFEVIPLKSGEKTPPTVPLVPITKRKKETSFAIIAEKPPISRPSSPRSLPVEIRSGRVSPFKGRGFREETSRHNTPKTSATNSRNNSPPRRRTNSLSRIDNMAQTATLPPPIPFHRPPRDFLKENMEEIRELSELNREKNEAEAEKKRQEDEIALLKEMGILDKKGEIKSVVNSRTNSRSNSPGKINLRSRSNSPSAILHYENIKSDFINKNDGIPVSRPVAHKSRVRAMSKSQPQSSTGSPKNSKIPTRQNSMSPIRPENVVENGLKKNQRYMSNSTSSINETIRVGSRVHDKRVSQSTQHLDIPSGHIKGKPPISPGRNGPPPTNKSINSKRLSPIVGTPSKSPIQDTKSGPVKTTKPISATKTNAKTGNTPAVSRLNSRNTSRDTSPDKRKPLPKTSTSSKPPSRSGSTKSIQKPTVTPKVEITPKVENKKTISRTNSTKSLTPSIKSVSEKPPLNKRDSRKDLTKSAKKTENGLKLEPKTNKTERKNSIKQKDNKKEDAINGLVKTEEKITKQEEEVLKQDNGTQYDKTADDKGLVILTKKNIVSMTTAAITSQPLEVVATVTNQLPTTLEKARERAILERLSSKDSINAGGESKPDIEKTGEENKISEQKKETVPEKPTEAPKKEPVELAKESTDDKEKHEKDDKKPPIKPKSHLDKTIFCEDNVKLKLLQPPYNNPQVEKVRQKIDSILKEPEISTENILAGIKPKETLKSFISKIQTETQEAKIDIEEETKEVKDEIVKKADATTSDIVSKVTKTVDSVITPIEESKETITATVKENIEPIIAVVKEKKIKEEKIDIKPEITEKVNETLVQGGPEVEVQSSNMSTTGVEKIAIHTKHEEADGSEKSHSNGGFPQSTSTTPKPPPRAHRESKEKTESKVEPQQKTNICSRLLGKCKNKCCPCCVKGEDEEETGAEIEPKEKKSFWSRTKRNKMTDEELERAAGKAASIEFESETKRKRKFRDVFCACCRRQRVADVTEPPRHVDVSPPVTSSDVVKETGCFGKKREAQRRDSILSDHTSNMCCNNRLCRWVRGACRRQSEHSSSRRTSLFSKNKSLSPTLPPEDNRKKLDASLVEHTSMMRGAIPVLPLPLAYFCLFCNIIVPGLGTIFSGIFCLCFGIPRFGVHDGARHRIGSFIINLLIGAGQLFTVLFCLVGWGWSIWWGVIMIRTARKYLKLKAEAAAAEAEAPPVTANNHTRA